MFNHNKKNNCFAKWLPKWSRQPSWGVVCPDQAKTEVGTLVGSAPAARLKVGGKSSGSVSHVMPNMMQVQFKSAKQETEREGEREGVRERERGGARVCTNVYVNHYVHKPTSNLVQNSHVTWKLFFIRVEFWFPNYFWLFPIGWSETYCQNHTLLYISYHCDGEWIS